MSGPGRVAIVGAIQSPRQDGERFEELVFRVCRAALDDAGLTREDLDTVTLAASDERDGRSISSMLAAMPAGGLLKEVTKVTDSSLHALALAAAKILAGCSEVGLVSSWEILSEVADPVGIGATALEPFYERAVPSMDPVATAMLAEEYLAQSGTDPAALDARAHAKARAAGAGDGDAAWVAWPLRAAHFAPDRDGAAAVILVSEDYAAEHGLTPIAYLEGIGWGLDTYSPAERERPLGAALRNATASALARAGVSLADIDSFELDDANVFTECLAAEGVGLAPEGTGLAVLTGARDPLQRVADDGFAGLPAMASGLWRLAQVCAAPAGRGRSLIHQTTGRAAQGHAVAVVHREGRA